MKAFFETLRGRRLAWYLYDFGNSAYAATVILAIYPNFFKDVVVGGPDGTRLWGFANAAAMLAVMLVSPILGALAGAAAITLIRSLLSLQIILPSGASFVMPQHWMNVFIGVILIGAVIGEWVGASAGLGFLMLQANAQMQVDLLFAALVVLAAFAIVFYALIDATLRRLVPWQPVTAQTD